MAKKKRTWRERLADDQGFPQVQEITDKLSKRWGTGTFVIPAPREVNEIMSMVPLGKLITINQIRQTLARKHGATIGCPITTGIFAWISANAAAEDIADGLTDITPYWRTLKSKGELNPKYPGGVEEQATRLEAEGHTIDFTRKNPRVKDHEEALVEV